MGCSAFENRLKLPRGLIISSQASVGEPLYDPEMLAAMAESGIWGGAVAVRLEGVPSIRAFKARRPDIPIIGLIKTSPPDGLDLLDAVYITPTLNEIQALIDAGADFIALDSTIRSDNAARPASPSGALSLNQRFAEAHQAIQESGKTIGLWADCATVQDGLNALQLGFDVVSTTLSGYTRETAPNPEDPDPGPDFHMLSALVRAHEHAQIVLEGRVWEPWQVREAFDLGAHAVVVGSALTRPILMTRRFCDMIPSHVSEKVI